MLLERHWARAGKGMVPLLLGFVGLPSMRQRIGGDLMGVLNPMERSTMKEAELRPLIKRMAPRLQTTEEARIRLAEASGNLLVLRALLDRLAVHLNREQRRWANYDDVFLGGGVAAARPADGGRRKRDGRGICARRAERRRPRGALAAHRQLPCRGRACPEA